MRADQVKPVELPTVEKKVCIMCGKSCMPYARTYRSHHLCSKVCSDKWDGLDAKVKSGLHTR